MKCPESIEELKELEKLIPLCKVTLYEQAKARIETGSAKSVSEASRQLAEETGRSPESIRNQIRRADAGGQLTSLTGTDKFKPLTLDDSEKKIILKEASSIKKEQKEELLRQREERLAGKKQPFPDNKYQVILADPPWTYNDKCNEGAIQSAGADKHYPTMKLQEICDLPINRLAADNAVLFIWTTSPLLEDVFQVINAWGFRYVASFVWDKIKHNMGHYNSVRHEFLLIAVRGSCTPDNLKLFDSVQSIERTKHSEKPTVFYEIIETLYLGKKIELFARGRNKREGWASWGLEL